MTLFELLFIVSFLTFVVSIGTTAIAALRGRRPAAGRRLRRTGLAVAAYLAVVVVVALLSPQRVVAIGQDRCFDDWCVAVADLSVTPTIGQGATTARAAGQFFLVTLRLSNHARGRPQRVSSAAVGLRDADGVAYSVSAGGQAAFEAQHGAALPLTTTIDVGQSVETVRVFDVPDDAQQVGLTIRHPVGPAPGLFIIGDEASLFHRPTVIRLR